MLNDPSIRVVRINEAVRKATPSEINRRVITELSSMGFETGVPSKVPLPCANGLSVDGYKNAGVKDTFAVIFLGSSNRGESSIRRLLGICATSECFHQGEPILNIVMIVEKGAFAGVARKLDGVCGTTGSKIIGVKSLHLIGFP
jgi:hypothetical protein